MSKWDDIQELINEISNYWFYMGIVSGIRASSEDLLDSAAEEFKNGNDNYAHYARQLSNKLNLIAKEQEKKPNFFKKDICYEKIQEIVEEK